MEADKQTMRWGCVDGLARYISCRNRGMQMTDDPLFVVVLLAVAAVVIVLMIGLGGFAGGGEFNKKRSNKLMRYRSIAQCIAVLLILGGLWHRG